MIKTIEVMEKLIDVVYRVDLGITWVEGTCDTKPTEKMVKEHGKRNLWEVNNIQMVWDSYGEYWRFNGDTEQLQLFS